MLYDKRALYTLLEQKEASLEFKDELPLDVKYLAIREGIELKFCSFDSDSIFSSKTMDRFCPQISVLRVCFKKIVFRFFQILSLVVQEVRLQFF